MSKRYNEWICTHRPQPERPRPGEEFLPMDLTADEALAAWHALWELSTNPVSILCGDRRHLAAYRQRYEALALAEAGGPPALPVALPSPLLVEEPTENQRIARLFGSRRGRCGGSHKTDGGFTKAMLAQRRREGAGFL